MSVVFDPGPAAAILAAARRSPERIDGLPEAMKPRDTREAYALQRRLARVLGTRIGGYKLGLSSEAAMERSGLGAPVAGFVPSSQIHSSGAVLDMPREGTVLIEVEIVFTLGASIEAGSVPSDVRDVIASANLAFELVRSRFKDPGAAGLPSFIGDGSGFHALVMGERIALNDVPALLERGASLSRNGKPAVGAAGERERPDPFAVLARFLPLAAEHGMTLTEGMVVATGDLVLPFETAEPGLYEGFLPPAAVKFTARATQI